MLQRRVGKLRPEFNQTMLIIDNAPDSQYFRVADIPGEFTAGKNSFKLYGDNNFLKPGSEILIQITDISGNAVYHHVNNYVDSSGRLLISVYIYPETPPGIAQIKIIGVARKRPNGGLVPASWRNKFNVIYNKTIFIEPEKVNKTPIVFQKIPGVTIREYEREYLTQTYLSGESIASSSDGSVTYNYQGSGNATITVTGGAFSSSMAGGIITIPSPTSSINLPNSSVIVSGSDTTYSAFIDSVISSTALKAAPFVLNIESSQLSTNRDGTISIASFQNAFPVNSFGPVSNYSIEWQQDATYATGSQNSQSFASITLKNIEPIAGNVHSIKTYMRSHGYQDFLPMSEMVLQERDLLVDLSSDLAYDPMGDFKSQEIIDTFWASSSVNQPGFTPYAKHDDSQMISSVLISGSEQLSGSANYPQVSKDDAFIKFVTKTGIELYQNNEYQVKFKVVCESDTPAQVSSSRLDIYISGSHIGNSDICTDGNRNLGTHLITLETDNVAPNIVTNVSQFLNIAALSAVAGPVSIPNNNYSSNTNVTLNASFDPNTATAVSAFANGSIQENDTRRLEVSFTPVKDTTAHLVFAASRGKWYISDVEIEGANDFGFTPNHTFIEIPIQTAQADDILDFKFEFYNANGDLANVSLVTQSISFVGSNLYVSGNDNFMSGSLNVGGGIVMQGFTGN